MIPENVIQSPDKSIVDVRSRMEFASGSVNGAINIPLDEVNSRMSEIQSLSGPVILCCASGGRSAMARHMIASGGREDVYDGGGWMSLNAMLQGGKHA